MLMRTHTIALKSFLETVLSLGHMQFVMQKYNVKTFFDTMLSRVITKEQMPTYQY